jgi:hypothetical protein
MSANNTIIKNQLTGETYPNLFPTLVSNTITTGVLNYTTLNPPPTGTTRWNTSGANIYNNNAGNVGIGTTSPTTNLGVAGNANVSGTLTSGSINTGAITASGVAQLNGGVQTTNLTATNATITGSATLSGLPTSSQSQVVYINPTTGVLSRAAPTFTTDKAYCNALKTDNATIPASTTYTVAFTSTPVALAINRPNSTDFVITKAGDYSITYTVNGQTTIGAPLFAMVAQISINGAITGGTYIGDGNSITCGSNTVIATLAVSDVVQLIVKGGQYGGLLAANPLTVGASSCSASLSIVKLS